MKIRSHWVMLSVAAVLMGAVALPLHAAKKNGGGSTTGPIPLVSNVYDYVVDEQNTNLYFGGNTFSDGSNSVLQQSDFSGDSLVAGPSSAYGFGSPWTLADYGVSSTHYEDGTDCGSSCLSLQFDSGSKTISFDTRGTIGPRAFTLSFLDVCGSDCGNVPAGSASVFGGGLTTPGLLNVFLSYPFTSMGVCSSIACPEAQTGNARFWFADPTDSSVTWRVDWAFIRVLRMSSSTWYVLADEADYSQIAGLSKLSGNRSRPKAVLNGYYKIPFFLEFDLK